MGRLDRFYAAQADPHAGFATALREPVLGDRLVQAAAAARRHLTGPGALSVALVMGSVVDALKLVSSMTLFGHVAERLQVTSPEPRFAAMAGHDRCAFTAARLGLVPPDPPAPGSR